MSNMYEGTSNKKVNTRVKAAVGSIAEHGRVISSTDNVAETDSRHGKKLISLTDPVIVAAVMVLDAVVVFVGSIAAWRIYHDMSGMAPPDWHVYMMAGCLLALTFLLRGLDTTVYGNIWGVGQKAALTKTGKDFAQAFLIFVTFLVMTRWAVTYSRGSLIAQFLICGSAIIATRAIELKLLRDDWVRKFVVTSRVILIGSAAEIMQARSKWRARQENVQIVNAFPIELHQLQGKDHSTFLGDFAETVVRTSRQLKADRIVLLLPFEQTGDIGFLVERLRDLPASIMISTESLTVSPVRREALVVGGLHMLRVVRKPLTAKDMIIKRAFDLSVSSVLLLLLAPLLFSVALAVRWDSPGRALFRQARKGFNQEQFNIFKFRSMREGRPAEIFKQTGKYDSRITPLGKALRRWNVDELPQLLNVLRGEMSLVGPRPHAVEHDDMFAIKIASYARRHNIKPGITGLAQVNGCRGATDTVRQMEDRINYDLAYVQNWSIFLDVKILFMTVFSPRAYRNAY